MFFDNDLASTEQNSDSTWTAKVVSYFLVKIFAASLTGVGFASLLFPMSQFGLAKVMFASFIVMLIGYLVFAISYSQSIEDEKLSIKEQYLIFSICFKFVFFCGLATVVMTLVVPLLLAVCNCFGISPPAQFSQLPDFVRATLIGIIFCSMMLMIFCAADLVRFYGLKSEALLEEARKDCARMNADS